MTRRSLSRTNSSSSTLSCITILNEPRSSRAPNPSSTPPTSVTDVASISSANTSKAKTANTSLARPQRQRTNVLTYNENVLAGNARRSERVFSVLDPEHCTPSAISIKPADSSSKGLLNGIEREGSHTLRSQFVAKAATAISRTRNVLGKRNREVTARGRGESLVSDKRAILRTRNLSAPGSRITEPSSKRQKFIKSQDDQLERDSTRRKAKRYLAQGLYVGQETTWDSYYTGFLKKSQIPVPDSKSRRILPPPMFAGRILLEQGRNFRLPFNIFSPLPTGQPKPEEWRKTQKNVFVGDAAEFWKTSKNLEHSTCICEEESGCDENCFNRFMFYECDNDNCNIGQEHCTNRSFEELRKRCKKGGKYNIGVEVIKTSDRGYGVRSNRTFEPNQIIVEYTGEIITQDECDHRMRTMYRDNKCFYLMVFDQNMIIDATRGSIARFVNHACEPNCKMVKWTVAGKPRMALFAGEKGIMTGEELTYDYNFDPFSSKNIQECRCGFPSCRGVLGPRPKEKELKDALKSLIQTGTKRKLQEVLSSAKDVVQAVVNEKRKIAVAKSLTKAVPSIKKPPTLSTAEGKSSTSHRSSRFLLSKRGATKSTQTTTSSLKAGRITGLVTQKSKTKSVRGPTGTSRRMIKARTGNVGKNFGGIIDRRTRPVGRRIKVVS